MADNKFGMFIHFGVYAQLGLHEQALARYYMDHEEYEKLKDSFNPTKYDPEEWVLLAKRAGMKYICFTAKHHDGFCLWDTKYTDYNIMNTPYGKDFLKLLSEACKKHGILLSIYYSNPDWHHECAYNPNSSHQWKAKNSDHSRFDIYKTFIKNQITELLTGYGEIYTLFWDIPPAIYDPSINELARSLQPNILINDRGFDTGDFSTPEREASGADFYDSKHFERMTEACNSVGANSWGYRKNEDFYSLAHLKKAIARTMAKGGNYLLNVGPMADGSIAKEYNDRIEKIGAWYNRMGGCLEGHTEDTFDYKINPQSFVASKKNGKTYLTFPEGIYSTAVVFEKAPSMPKKARLVNNGEELPFDLEYFPSSFFDENMEKKLRIYNIPVDNFDGEPIIIEIEWEK